ncbi:hypothetical protein VPHD479_0302 [Vibrio phage D479]
MELVKQMNFNIVEIDEWDHSIVIDWGDGCVFKHHIPQEAIDYDLERDTLIDILETLRPEIPEVSSLGALKDLQKGQTDLSRSDEFQSLLDQLGD